MGNRSTMVWTRSRTRRALTTCLSAGLVGMLVCAGVFPDPALTQEAASFRGKSVRVIVGSVPGGINGVGAGTIARFIGKYLPDSPNVFVQNIPAANGIAAANYFYQ